eukprot:gene44922-54944_t
MSEISRLEQRVKELESEINRKKQIIQDMSAVLQDSEEQYEELKKENAKLKDDLAKATQCQPNKNQSSSSRQPSSNDEDEEDDETIEQKVTNFLVSLLSPHINTQKGSPPIPRAMLHSIVINTLAALYHLDRNEEVRPSALTLSLTPSVTSWREHIHGEIDLSSTETTEVSDRLAVHASYLAFQSALTFFAQQ